MNIIRKAYISMLPPFGADYPKASLMGIISATGKYCKHKIKI